MNALRTTICLLLTFSLCLSVAAQSAGKVFISLIVVNTEGAPLPNSTVALYQGNTLVKIQMTDSAGAVQFAALPGTYTCRISRVGYADAATLAFTVGTAPLTLPTVVLQPADAVLREVRVMASKPFIELQAGKTIVNMDASAANVGSNVLEALEKLPGITVDKEGTISLKGKAQVLVLINNKPAYLSGPDLAVLLQGMNAAQLSQVEIMTTPPARYDAAGNAGVINLKTKKSEQKGFNASLTTTYTQGIYPKNSNSVSLNYRGGKLTLFANYSVSFTKNFLDLWANRTYYKPDGITVQSYLEQPSFIGVAQQAHSLRTGFDYALSSRSVVGVGFTGLLLSRDEEGSNRAIWKNAALAMDSVLATSSTNHTDFKNGGINLNYRYSFSPNRQLGIDADVLQYSFRSRQFFENHLPNGAIEASSGYIPSDIKIYTAKADYEVQAEHLKWEAGWKSSRINTSNPADYAYTGSTGGWKPDYTRTNHFLYNEYIHALYGMVHTKEARWTVQGGLRFEATQYDATQRGNPTRKDSSFSRSYNSLFPSASVSFAADSFHTFSFSAARRIDRPAFDKLNPFSLVINKYTYQVGNPYFRPQFTWNFELSHLYKNTLITTLSYSRTTDYFSQIFYANNGIITYTQGNLGELQVLALTVAVQAAPTRWWSLSAQAVLQQRAMQGQILKGQFVQTLDRAIGQGTFSINNQLKWGRGWGAELSGTYTTRSRQDIQELVAPSGQLSLGFSKTLLQNKATLKLALRDIFYTQAMVGFTEFQYSTEDFSLRRDTRVMALSFNYRLGKAFKAATKRSAATEEAQRASGGN